MKRESWPLCVATPLALAALSLFWASTAHAAYDPETDGWKLGIGDASAFGYFAVALYMAASLVFHRRVRLDSDGFSKAASYGMLFLALNKGLDLQTAVADWGKHVALDGHWYGGRSVVQLTFIALGVLFGVWALWSLPRRLGATWPHHRMTALPLTGLVVFILVRASSLHQLSFLGREWSGIRVGTAVEVGLTMLVILGAQKSMMSRTKTRAKAPVPLLPASSESQH